MSMSFYFIGYVTALCDTVEFLMMINERSPFCSMYIIMSELSAKFNFHFIIPI